MNTLMTQDRENFTITFDEEKTQLLKDTICKGATDEEFKLFLYACKRTGLDPFMKQIHAVKRPDKMLKREVMSIQTGIDGYRLIAERTGRYVPGRDTEFLYDKDGKLFKATSFVMKQTADGKWHEVSASAFYEEYVGRKFDGSPNHMWATKGHIMLGKCSEALALRKAFPNDLSGIYTREEMEQADNVTIMADVKEVKPISKAQVELISLLISKDANKDQLMDLINKRFNSIEFIPSDVFDKTVEWVKNRQEKQAKEVKQIEAQTEEENECA